MALILIVDDRADFRQALAALLDSKGHRVMLAAHGAQALELVRRETPDLVITDGLMPVMDGFEMLRRLRNQSRLAGIRAIFYTGAYLDAEARGLAQACGVSRFLTKPETQEALLEAVDSTLSAAAMPEGGEGAELAVRHLRLLTDKLHHKAAELESSGAELDRRITERTAELAAENTKLVEEVRLRRRAESRLQGMVDRDSLTGLYNRRFFEHAVTREIARARRERATFGVVFADADHFKELNDVHGHAAGDAALVTLGRHLQSCVRAEDIVCRYGGEEFVVLLVRAGMDGIAGAAERMRAGVNVLRIPGFDAALLPPTLSIGTAVWPEHGHDGGALMRAADAALYRAKRAGRNRVEMATPSLSDQ